LISTNSCFTADERCQRHRQIRTEAALSSALRRAVIDHGDWTGKPVAAPCERFDPALAARCLSERAPDGRDLHGEIAFFHDDTRPCRVDDGFLADAPVRRLEQDGEHRHRACA
jgi:hypothetical protein